MNRRASVALLAGLLVLAACGGHPEAERTPMPSVSVSPSGSPNVTPTPSATTSPTPAACSGVGYADVLGSAPSYGPGRLRSYPLRADVCAAYWLPQSDDLFVPQSLAVDATTNTAYVGGYHWAPTFPPRPCQIAVIDLATGAVKAFQPKFQASIYHPAPTYCRHGGGMQLVSSGSATGLWVQETQRLWLLDPTKLGQGAEAPVDRWWRMGQGLRGSAMVIQDGRVGVASFNPRHRGRIYWFALADLLRPGVTDLALRDGSSSVATPVTRGRVPRLLQGITVGTGGLYYSASGSGCAQLIGPDGTRHDFVPGSEGLQFVDSDLYVASESGARPYLRGTAKANVPVLTRLPPPPSSPRSRPASSSGGVVQIKIHGRGGRNHESRPGLTG